VLDIPIVTPGTGQHAYRASCAHCHAYIQWLSHHDPAEQARRRAQAKQAVMQAQAPTADQLHYLDVLGDHGPLPAHKWEASRRIDELIRRRGA
jgi:hypothetical protein